MRSSGGRAWRASLLALSILLASSPAVADDPDLAAALFKEGRAAFAEGQFVAAARKFEEANRHAPRAAVLYNAGLAWESAGDRPRAADAFQQALQMGGLEASLAGDASKKLAALKKTLGVLDVVAPVGAVVSVAHVSKAAIPVQVHVTPGEHEVAVNRSDGARAKQSVRARAGETVRVELDLVAPPPPASPVGPASAAPSSPPALVPRRADPAPPPSGPGPGPVVGFVSLGASALLSGTAIYLGVNALDARDEFNASGETDADARDRAASLRTWTNVAWAGAGACLVLGAVLVVATWGTSGAPPDPASLPAARSAKLTW